MVYILKFSRALQTFSRADGGIAWTFIDETHLARWARLGCGDMPGAV